MLRYLIHTWNRKKQSNGIHKSTSLKQRTEGTRMVKMRELRSAVDNGGKEVGAWAVGRH